MKELFIGEVIKRRREELGLSQEKLCEGICEPITLSRFESGKNIPAHNRVKALLQRLNLPDNRYYALLSKHELKLNSIRAELLSCTTRFECAPIDKAKQLWTLAMEQLQELEMLVEEDDRITRQFILSHRATLGREDGPYPLRERLAILLDALHLTAPNFDLEYIGARRYTVDETRIINQIAGTFSYAEDHEKALAIYRQLFEYVYKNDDQLSNFAPHLTLIAYNYTRELALCKYYHEAIQAAEKGLQVSVNYFYYQFLPGFLALLGECYYMMGEEKASRERYLQAHYLYEVLEDQKSLSIIDSDIRERFGIEFSNQQ